MDGGGDGYGCVGGIPCTHAHAHVHTRMHAHMHMHVKHVVNMINMDASMSAAICNFFTCINVRVCMCMCAHAYACVGGHPAIPPDAPHSPAPSPEPQGAQNTKIQ